MAELDDTRPETPALLPGARICASGELLDCGRGRRFTLIWRDRFWPAFVIRYRGAVYAYLNRCAHRAVELDWNPGDFFDLEGRSLVCATHGARYHPATGACLGGPCLQNGLRPLPVNESDGEIRLGRSDDIHLDKLLEI